MIPRTSIPSGCIQAFGLFAFAIAAYLGSGTLGTSNPPPSPTTTLLMIASLLVLALASFVSSFFVLRGFSARVFWYIMNAVWLGLLAYSSTLHFQFWTAYYSSFANTYSEPVIALVLLSPFVYAISCIAYFLTKKPRK